MLSPTSSICHNHKVNNITLSPTQSDCTLLFSTLIKIRGGALRMNAKFKCAIWKDAMMNYGPIMIQDGPEISGQPGPIGIAAILMI